MPADSQTAGDGAPQNAVEPTAPFHASERTAPAAEDGCLRWVQLTVDPAQHAVFLHLFKNYQKHIQNFPGCRSVELLEGSETGQFFTLSRWSAESDLENYRTSPLFAEIWPPVKATFSAPARAWTVRPVAIPA
jgi:heme-degrading monooxygenase HmoA